MGATPPQPPSQVRFSPDGAWFWTGTEWKPAISPDRRWRWNGLQWVPNVVAAGTSPAAAAGITIGIIGGGFAVLVLVSIVVIVVLLTMGNQITNVFSNVVAALGASPTP